MESKIKWKAIISVFTLVFSCPSGAFFSLSSITCPPLSKQLSPLYLGDYQNSVITKVNVYRTQHYHSNHNC